MKLIISSVEITGTRKQEILDLLGVNFFAEVQLPCHTCHRPHRLEAKQLILTPEAVIDIAMYRARLDVLLTPEAEQSEIDGWEKGAKEIAKYLDNFDENRKKLKFIEFDYKQDRYVEAEDPMEYAKRAYL